MFKYVNVDIILYHGVPKLNLYLPIILLTYSYNKINYYYFHNSLQ